jgi:hypothetical protein
VTDFLIVLNSRSVCDPPRIVAADTLSLALQAVVSQAGIF